jgi:hypothetical protein
MPRQLKITTTPGSTAYAVVYRLVDGLYFNGTTFEQYVDADWASYAIAMADSTGAGDYVGSLPGAFPTTLDSYRVAYYLQAAGSPAYSDQALFGQDLVYTTPTVTVSSVYALTTLASVKQQLILQGTAMDAQLVKLINASSDAVERICGRKFFARDYSQHFDSNNQLRLMLKNPPINSVYRVAYGAQPAMYVTYNGTDIRSNAGIIKATSSSPDAGGSMALSLTSMSAAGVRSSNVLSFAKYPTCSTLIAAVNAIAGWTAVLSNVNVPTAELYPTGGQDAGGRQVFLNYPLFGTPEYYVDYNTGILQYRRGSIWPNENGWHNEILATRMPRGFQQMFVHYNAGWTTIPSEVDQKCCEIVQDTYNQSLSDTTKQSVRMGEGGYTNFSLSDQQKSGIRRDLSQYVLENTMIAGGTRS